MLVVDSSFLVAALFEEEHTPFVEGVLGARLGEDLIAPGLLRWEIANVIRTKVTKRLIDAEAAEARLGAVEALGLRSPQHEPTPTDLLRLALSASLSAYDAAYVDLAVGESCALATLDRGMAGIAGTLGVAVISPFA